MKTLIKQAFTSWPHCIATYVAILGFFGLIAHNVLHWW